MWKDLSAHMILRVARNASASQETKTQTTTEIINKFNHLVTSGFMPMVLLYSYQIKYHHHLIINNNTLQKRLAISTSAIRFSN